MAKNTTRQSKGFVRTAKHIHSIGRLIREIFMYGNRSRLDFAELGFDDRSFDDQRRRIEACIQDEFIDFSIKADKSKCWKFKTDFYNNSYNFLFEAYRIKTITANLYWEIIFMQILAISNTPLSKMELLDYFDSYKDLSKGKFNTPIEYPDINIVNRGLDKLLSYGWIYEIRTAKPFKYALTKSLFDVFSYEELFEIYSAVTFFKNVAFLSVPGYYLEKTLEDYCIQKFNKQFNDHQYFQYRFHNFSKIFDDKINFVLNKAIAANKYVRITKNNNKPDVIVTPTSVSITYPYNKQQIKTKEGININIDIVESIKITDVKPKKVHINPNGKQHRLELRFTFRPTDDINEVLHIKNRLKQEAAWMDILEETDNEIIYTALVKDSRQYVPWIRTFHKYVSFTENTNKYLVRWIENDKLEVLANYGAIL